MSDGAETESWNVLRSITVDYLNRIVALHCANLYCFGHLNLTGSILPTRRLLRKQFKFISRLQNSVYLFQRLWLALTDTSCWVNRKILENS